MSEKTKKPFKMPHTFVIIFTIILAAVALTWIIPAGEYARFENAEGIKVIDPSQFSYIARTPVNPLLIPL
ncbi:Predicted membrane protein [butyrate-producing bacterium SM4/1]|nr:Predicted membrane protein [butyrate-producing bacterium SM4/1]